MQKMLQFAKFAVHIVVFSISIAIKVIPFTTYRCEAAPISKSFYIRHYSGKCLNYDITHQTFVFHNLCRDKFRWKGGVRLIHTASKKCVVPQSSAIGSHLTISDQCVGTDSLFQYDDSTKMMKHFLTSRCLRPESGADPPVDAPVTLKPGSFILLLISGTFRTRTWFTLHHCKTGSGAKL